MRHALLQPPLIRRTAIAIFLLASFLSILGCDYRSRTSELMVRNPVLIADNKGIIFSYQQKNRHWRLAIFKTETQEMAPLNLPLNLSWERAVPSPDGKFLAAVTFCSSKCPENGRGRHIVLLDLSKEDVNYKFLTKGDGVYRESPVFSSDGQNIVFISGEYYTPTFSDELRVRNRGYSIVSLNGDDEKRLVVEESQFYYVGTPSFVGYDHFIFPGVLFRVKRDKGRLEKEAKKYPKSGIDPYGFSYRFGGRIELLPENANATLNQLTASESGQMVFIGFSQNILPNEDNYVYELYILENGEVRALTDLRTFIHQPFMSRDGKHVVFLADKTKKLGVADIWYLDVESGTVYATGIRDKILEEIKAEEASE